MSIDVHSLMAPYALDALDPHERALFERHLDQCGSCRAELAGFLETSARLGGAEGRRPPAALRDRVLAVARKTPQERPTVTALAPRGFLVRTLPRLAVAAALVLGLVGIGGFLIERNNADDYRTANESITAVLSAPDADSQGKSFEGGGTFRLISSESRDRAIIVARDLPALTGDKVYQVWLISGSGPVSQGVFTGSGTKIMNGIGGAEQVAVTVEPGGEGSPQPTSDPILALQL